MPTSPEKQLQITILEHLAANGWRWTPPGDLAGARNSLGQLPPTDNSLYNKEFALIPEDLFGYIESTQREAYDKLFPDPLTAREVKKVRESFMSALSKQLAKPYASGGGVLNGLRKGFVFTAKGGLRLNFKLGEFAPASGENPTIVSRYEKNRLRVIHELEYSEHKKDSIDLAFFLNGLPVLTAELKSGLGQNYGHAIDQYKNTRTPWAETGSKSRVAKRTEPLLDGSRAIAHFAVDPSDVYMTTQLRGVDTYFSPFNAGGDPENPERNKLNGGYSTSYLWEDFLYPDAFINVLDSFVIQMGDDGAKKNLTIFPRYHQWFGVSVALACTLREGIGHNSLMHWSAGSGKSHGISWLAHALSKLHYENIPYQFENLSPGLKAEVLRFAPVALHSHVKGKVFTGGGFVVTDRTNLDSQLNDTIGQKDSVEGTVIHADGKTTTRNSQGKDSKSKASYLSHTVAQAGSPIILCTLQTFPHALDEINESLAVQVKTKRETTKAPKTFFVIRDEAHTAEGGKNTQKMIEMLNSSSYVKVLSQAEKEVYRKQIESGEISIDDLEESLIEELIISEQKSRADRSHISYFAFTATPKASTLKLYGRPNPDVCNLDGSDKLIPLHTYSMKQAIRECYILDVVKNYTTFDMAFQIGMKNDSGGNQLVSANQGRKEILEWARKQPETLGQKASIILDHYTKTAFGSLLQIDGKEKAQGIVFARSREDALLYKRALDEKIRRDALTLKTLVAYSGVLKDPDTGEEINESQANGFAKNKDIAKAFEVGDLENEKKPYHLLVVASKYQTGYDNPRLVAAYIDKPLRDIEAVQAISRLNRIAPKLKKAQVFVLDFVNDYDEIMGAFAQYYTSLSLEDKTDENSLNRILQEIESREIYSEIDLDTWIKHRVVNNAPGAQGVLLKVKGYYDTLHEKAVDSGNDETVKWLEEYRLLLKKYVEVYGFHSLITDFKDSLMEKQALFFSSLYSVLLPIYTGTVKSESVDLDNLGIVSSTIRSQEHEDGIYLPIETITLGDIENVSSVAPSRDEDIHLLTLINYINDLFNGLDGITEIDKNSFTEHAVNKILEDSSFSAKARTNDFARFHSSTSAQDIFRDVLTSLLQSYEKMVEEIYKSDKSVLDKLRSQLMRIAFDKVNNKQ